MPISVYLYFKEILQYELKRKGHLIMPGNGINRLCEQESILEVTKFIILRELGGKTPQKLGWWAKSGNKKVSYGNGLAYGLGEAHAPERINGAPWLVWLMDRALSCAPKACLFNSRSGHMPAFGAQGL